MVTVDENALLFHEIPEFAFRNGAGAVVYA